MAEKKLQGPIDMRCVKWHLKNGKPWRCARFRPPEKPPVAKPKRKRKPRTVVVPRPAKPKSKGG